MFNAGCKITRKSRSVVSVVVASVSRYPSRSCHHKSYLSIDMISPGDGTDLSIRLDGDAGPATSGDEVLVSAMLSPVQT